MKLFHHHKYRFFLRDQDACNLAAPLTDDEWDALYATIRSDFEAAGLPVGGFSPQHTAIIEANLGYPPGTLRVYE